MPTATSTVASSAPVGLSPAVTFAAERGIRSAEGLRVFPRSPIHVTIDPPANSTGDIAIWWWSEDPSRLEDALPLLRSPGAWRILAPEAPGDYLLRVETDQGDIATSTEVEVRVGEVLPGSLDSKGGFIVDSFEDSCTSPGPAYAYGIDPTHGTIQWSSHIPYPAGTPPASDDGIAVAVSPRHDLPSVIAFDANGALWQTHVSGPMARRSPLVTPHGVFARTGDLVISLDRETGELQWSTKIAGRAMTELVQLDDLVIVTQGEPGSLVALDVATGLQRWRLDLGGTIWVEPQVAGSVLYVANGSDTIYGVDGAGDIVWTATHPNGMLTGWLYKATPDIVIGAASVAGSRHSFVVAVTVAERTVSWQRPLDLDIHFGEGIVAAIQGDDRGTLIAVDEATGAALWDHEFAQGVIPDQIAVSEGLILVNTRGQKGGARVTAFEASDGEIRWQTRLSEAKPNRVSLAPPTLLGGIVYVGATTHPSHERVETLHLLDEDTGALLRSIDLDHGPIMLPVQRLADAVIALAASEPAFCA